jgi:hypothetical protein
MTNELLEHKQVAMDRLTKGLALFAQGIKQDSERLSTVVLLTLIPPQPSIKLIEFERMAQQREQLQQSLLRFVNTLPKPGGFRWLN